MKLTRRKTDASRDTGIYFPKLECWNGEAKMATIAAQVNKQRVLCRISQKTLRNKYGASKDEPMQSVAQHRIAIQDAAKMLIESNSFEEDGSILILERDLA
jgi:hypothetical protein